MTAETDRAEIIELFGKYADIADLRRFDDLPRLVHTDPFILDVESVAGIPPTEISLADYARAGEASFGSFVATHHAITGHVISIDGDRATAHAHVRAEHWVPRESGSTEPHRWLVVGVYDNVAVRTAEGWRFRQITLTAAYQENAHLLQQPA